MSYQRQTDQAQAYRAPDDLDVWILGSSIASLASALHFIQDANVPASRIHILEQHSTPGDGLVSVGDPLNGYDHRAGCMPSFNDVCMEELLSLVPSANRSGRTALEDIREFNANKASVAGTHLLVHGDHGLKRVETRKLRMGLKDRMNLVILMLKTDKSLARKTIREFFSKGFFESTFWTVWSTIFSFQPWHSAVEFRRCLHRFFHEFHSLNDLKTLDHTQYNQHESIIVPIILFLQNRGVDFRFNTKIKDIVACPGSDYQTVSAIQVVQDGSGKTVTVGPNDIVIMSLGSVTSGSTSGTNKSPPLLQSESMEAEDDLDENWSLWLNLGTKNPKFGNPYNFCTRMRESRLESFTVTLRDAEFFDRFIEMTHDKAGLGALVSLKDSNWLLSLCIPQQPFFPDQPDDVQVLWGYGLCPEREGNSVKKPMLSCSGEEIMTELLWHLNFPPESILRDSITIPCVMPRMTATLLPRTYGDRPKVIPENTTNLALVGQFVEIPDETTVGMDYNVRGAQMAVYQLMNLHKEPKKTRKKNFITTFLGL